MVVRPLLHRSHANSVLHSCGVRSCFAADGLRIEQGATFAEAWLASGRVFDEAAAADKLTLAVLRRNGNDVIVCDLAKVVLTRDGSYIFS